MFHYIEKLNGVTDCCPMVICDLWGVLHNGVKAHAEAVEALTTAKQAGIAVGLLSNAPKSVAFIEKFINSIGISPLSYDAIVTSGSIARDRIKHRYRDARVFHLGPIFDEEIKTSLPVVFVEEISSADVILATGLIRKDGPSHRDMLKVAAQKGTEMIIANPDRVVHIGDKLQYCAGVVGDCYEAMKGPVYWCGKPTKEAFEIITSRLGISLEAVCNKGLMIGDSLKTDIAGAKAAELRSVFIADGIHRHDKIFHQDYLPSIEDFRSALGKEKPIPTYWMRSLK